jgi:hypothetical protein
MYAMKDTSMAGCANTVFQLVAACAALQTLAAVSTPEERCIDFPEQKYISEAGKKGR